MLQKSAVKHSSARLARDMEQKVKVPGEPPQRLRPETKRGRNRPHRNKKSRSDAATPLRVRYDNGY